MGVPPGGDHRRERGDSLPMLHLGDRHCPRLAKAERSAAGRPLGLASGARVNAMAVTSLASMVWIGLRRWGGHDGLRSRALLPGKGSRTPTVPDHDRMKSSTSRRPRRSAVLRSPLPWPRRRPADGGACQGPVNGPVRGPSGGPFRVPVAGSRAALRTAHPGETNPQLSAGVTPCLADPTGMNTIGRAMIRPTRRAPDAGLSGV